MKLGAPALVGAACLLAASVCHADPPPGPPRPKIESAAGVPVTFTSNDVAMHVYVARGDVPIDTYPDPFEKLAPLPYTVRLDPGTYTVEAQSPNASTGHERIRVEHDAPMKVDVRSGNAMVKTFGAVFTAVGVVSAILGVVWIAGIAPHDADYPRWGVGIPLLAGGAGVAGLGIGMSFAGATEIRPDHPRPSAATRTLSVSLSF